MATKKNSYSIDEVISGSKTNDEFSEFNLLSNWCWVKLGILAEFIDYRGKTPKKTTDGIRLITAKNIRMNKLKLEPLEFISNEDYDNWMTRGIPKKGDILLTTEAPLGNVAELDTDEKVAFAQRVITLVPKDAVYNRYLKIILQSPQLQYVLTKNSTGTTVSGIKSSRLKDVKIPLPPLSEQKRITKKVEHLLNKIDTAKQLIEEVKETFELRRAATLDKVFRGELTKGFRKSQRKKTNIELQNNAVKKFKSHLDPKKKENLYVLPEGWKWVELNDLIENMTYGSSSKTNDDVCGTPIIRMGNIQEGRITKVNYKYLPNDHPDVLKLDLQTNDILFNRTNSYELVGKSAIITEEFKGKYSFASYLIRLRLVEKDILGPYIVQFINSHIGREMLLSMVTQQVGQANINSQKLASLMIPLPTIEEIKEINKRLKGLDDSERNTIKILELDSTVNNLKQSILSKAFKGELGTNDRNDESAIELLKLILEEKL